MNLFDFQWNISTVLNMDNSEGMSVLIKPANLTENTLDHINLKNIWVNFSYSRDLEMLNL